LLPEKHGLKKHTRATPIVLLSNYAEAGLEKLKSEGLNSDIFQFREIENKYPKVHFITIMPKDLKYGFSKMWQTFAGEVYTNTHFVKSREDAEDLISSIIEGQ